MSYTDNSLNNKRLPKWLKMQRASGENYTRVKKLVESRHLHTICKSGNCPNIGECWNAGTATFMILGDICTRSCKFCGTITGKPLPPDPEEPENLAESVRVMGLKHCVITSVDRDDLPDSGASFWAEVIKKVKELDPGTTIEALIPDFRGVEKDIQKVIDAGPEVISHNLETVERLTPEIRSAAKYRRSLDVIRYMSERSVRTKSGIMLGLGEKEEEVYRTMDDLLEAGCSVLTLGQYLRPSPDHMEVQEYIDPNMFEIYRQRGLGKGFLFVESHPLVRSSYHAEKHVREKE
ncbi:MAG TPA: lipoyl synthase [Bacteroidetes bacterium]|nr:lipoyl synthase [Bacteroidota bacterium]